MMSTVMSSALTVCLWILLPAVKGFLTDNRLCTLSDALQEAESALIQVNETVRCGRGSRCYGLWEKTFDGQLRLLKQGCWTGNQLECVSDVCVLQTHTLDHHHFCCCNRDLCNRSPALRPITGLSRETSRADHLTSKEAVLVALATVAIAAILIIALLLGYHLQRGRKTVIGDDGMEASDGEPITDLKELKVLEAVGGGRFGWVFRGALKERCVAVKVFGSENHANFCRERLVYEVLPQHHNVARFLWAEERPAEFIIVMELYPHGRLSHYLSINTVDWWTICRMTHGVTLGLSFLHTAGESKVGVAHRDLSSRTVLVRADLSCVLADFHLSITLTDSPRSHGDQDNLSLTELGTVRYLPPEVLGGATNVDWRSALKQGDVYALGLMFWESFRRCSDLFPGEPPEFQLAFQAELGDSVTLDQMKTLILTEKVRPPIPHSWKDNTQLCSLVEVCWDQDPEARLTAQSVEERLSELTLMSVHNSGWPEVGVVMTTGSEADVSDRNRKCVKEQGGRVTPPSLFLLPQVEMGVAKMDMLTTEPHLVTTVTNPRRRDVQSVSNAEEGGRTNRAGPQEEEEEEEEENEEEDDDEDEQQQPGALNMVHYSPDEQEPLLRREEPQNHQNHQSRTRTNSNNNNNHWDSAEQYTSRTPPPQEEPAGGPEPEDAATETKCSDPHPTKSAEPQSTGPDLPRRGRTNPRRAERPRSLDLSPPDLTSEAPPSASAEKIKRRVKTPYALKKWRPASWVVSTDVALDQDFEFNHNKVSFGLQRAGPYRINQSKSSMAVFLVGGGATETTTSDPDGVTSF